MDITLYSTGCPKCIVLENKLKSKKIDFEIIDDIKIMKELKIFSAPVLVVDGKEMEFMEAITWINSLEE